jgi:polar amino acid transport system substrate-binding protein
MIRIFVTTLTLAGALAGLMSGSALAQTSPLRSALDGVAPPFAQPTMEGGVEGLSVDTVKIIAERLGRKLNLEAASFTALIPGLQAGTYDLLSAPMTATPERAQSMLFTEGLWNTDYQFVLPVNAPDVKELSDLKGKTIAVNKGTVYDTWARGKVAEIGWTVESYASTNDSVQAVQSGRAGAALLGDAQAVWLPKQTKGIKPSTYRFVTGLVFAYAVAKDNVALRDAVEGVIECMKQDGTMAKLYETWMGVAPPAGSATVTVFPGFGVPTLAGYDAAPHAAACKS